MTAPDKGTIEGLINSYYASHFAAGTQVDVSVGEITEDEDGGHVVNAEVKFLRKSSGDKYETKITLPFRGGALDWTSLTPGSAADNHGVGPDEKPAVVEKGREPKAIPLPANNEKPKSAKPLDDDPRKYIQDPEKVGSTSEARVGGDEWLSESEAIAPDPDADPNDMLDDNPTIFEETGLNDGAALSALNSFSQHSEQVPSGLRSSLVEGISIPDEPEFEPTDVALLEYYGQRESDKGLYEFKLWFTKEEARQNASALLQLLEEVEDIREDEGNALAVSVRKLSEEDDPASSVIISLNEAGQLQVQWEDGHEEEYLKEAGDNASFYHKGVQTQANQPGKPELGGGQNKPGDEQGGDKKGHSGIGKQGGTGVGKTKPVKAKKKITGAKSESVEEQADLFTDIISFDKGAGDEEEVAGEEEIPGEEAVGELDPTILELVQVQAENGLDTVLQMAQVLCDEKGIEWSEEIEQQVRDEFGSVAGEGGEEEFPPEEEEVVAGEEEVSLEPEVPEEESEEEEKPDSKLTELTQEEVEKALAEYLEDLEWVDDLNEAELTEVEPMVYPEDELEEKAKLGTGARFKALKKELGGREDEGGVKDPGGLAAWIGRKKHGKDKMAKMAAAGKESKDKNPALSIAEAKQVFELELTDEELVALEGGSLTGSAAKSLVYEGEGAKKKVTEALKAVAAERMKLKEKSENDTYLGAMASWQRIQSKKRPASPYGRVKPNVKFQGKVRVVWDDGDESWEAPGDVQAVSNPHDAKSPSGGVTKPKSVKLTKQGGEEFKMLKSLEALRKVESGGQRFLRAVDMQMKGEKFDGRLVKVLTEGWDEFGHQKSSPVKTEEGGKLAESTGGKQEEEKGSPLDQLTEDLDGLDDSTIEIIAEDFGDELRIYLPDITEDLETEEGE